EPDLQTLGEPNQPVLKRLQEPASDIGLEPICAMVCGVYTSHLLSMDLSNSIMEALPQNYVEQVNFEDTCFLDFLCTLFFWEMVILHESLVNPTWVIASRVISPMLLYYILEYAVSGCWEEIKCTLVSVTLGVSLMTKRGCLDEDLKMIAEFLLRSAEIASFAPRLYGKLREFPEDLENNMFESFSSQFAMPGFVIQ
ncbi:unnamed protein product, partial [Musa acuminata subsp. burmannicoides]